LFKLFSIAGIASKNNCPMAGQFAYNTCTYTQAQDAAGSLWEAGTPAQAFTDGNCGYTLTVGQPTYGECGFPPSGWAVDYQPSYVSVDPIYWTHPNNPQAGQLAYAGGQFVYTYGITYVTTWPETYSTGASLNDGDLFLEITGIDGWILRITYSAFNNGYNAVEDDLTPEEMPDPNFTP
jgi:hypothetical protein